MKPDLHTDDVPAARRYEYDDRTVIAADFGPETVPTIDVVDGTAIVVVGNDQREFDLPDGDVQTFTRNGVVTIEVRG